MKTYLVGGAVRDMLMGVEPHDRDYVVVGSTEKEMEDSGYQKVGAAFAVFLHPETKAEYALARKEKKTGLGHAGFQIDIEEVSLQDDLMRRDLTINAMAIDDRFMLVDPFGGREDLLDKVFRHVSSAFSEDPLRVLRVARFSAKYPNFTIAPETLELMKEIVESNDFKSLSQERVLKEMLKALGGLKPSNFFNVLRSVGGLDHFFPEIKILIDVPQNPKWHPEGCAYTHTMMVLDHSVDQLPVRFACLVHDLGKGITPKELLPAHHNHEETGIPLVEDMCKRLKVSNELKEAAIAVTRNHLRVHRILEANPSSLVRMFYEMNAFKKPHLVEILAHACKADSLGKRTLIEDSWVEYPNSDLLIQYFDKIKDIAFKDIRQDLTGKKIADEIRATRVRILKGFINATRRDSSNV